MDAGSIRSRSSVSISSQNQPERVRTTAKSTPPGDSSFEDSKLGSAGAAVQSEKRAVEKENNEATAEKRSNAKREVVA